jgi:hypothetical protein
MSKSTTIKRTKVHVINAAGVRTFLVVSTPVVTESTFDGPFTHELLATITDPRGVHVNRKSDTEFESIDGETYRLASD